MLPQCYPLHLNLLFLCPHLKSHLCLQCECVKQHYNAEQRSYTARGSGSLQQLWPCTLSICNIPTLGQDLNNVAEGQRREKILLLIPLTSGGRGHGSWQRLRGCTACPALQAMVAAPSLAAHLKLGVSDCSCSRRSLTTQETVKSLLWKC